MIEQVGVGVAFYAFFVASKTGKTGLSVTVDVWRITEAGVATEVVTGGSATEIGDGLYRYGLTAVSVTDAGEYVAVFKTADSSVDSQHIPAIWTVGHANIEYLDTAISSRNATTPPTAGAVSDAVWDEALSEHGAAGSAGAALALAGSAADPLLNPVPGSYASGSAGHALGRIASGQLTAVQAALSDGFVRVVPGDDYSAAIGTAIDITGDSWPDVSGAEILWIFGETTFSGLAVNASTVRLELTSAQSTQLGVDEPGQEYYSVVALIPTETPGVRRRVTLVHDARRMVG